MLTVASVNGSVRVNQVGACFFGRAVDVTQTAIALVGLEANHLSIVERFKWLTGFTEKTFLCIALEL